MYVPWMANARYGTNYSTEATSNGRIMSWGDWLYSTTTNNPPPPATASPTSLPPTAVPPTVTNVPPQPSPTPIPVQPTATTVVSPTTIVIQPTATTIPSTPVPTQPTTVVLPTTTTVAQATATLNPTAEKVYDDKNPLFVYSTGWQNVSHASAYNRSYKETTRGGATVKFPFTGQSFSILYKGGPSFNVMEVYVDGALIATINQRLSTATYQRRWDYPGQLTAGRHTLKLVFKAASGSTSRGSIDAVIVR
jgi:hypothetical protein